MENYSNLEKLSNDFKNLFQNQNQNEKEEESYFDFEIICEQNKTSFKTHKSILSSRSDYFKSLFNSKMKEYQENKLILKDVSSPILFPILNYLYSGKIEINLENAIEILIFSSKYLIDELIETCSNFIKNNLQIETVVDILKLSESRNLNQLIDYSYQFILENFEEFIKTSFFLELEENHLNSILSNDEIATDEFEIFELIIKWGKHKSNINEEKEIEKEKLQNQISNIIHKIRFIDFSKQQIAKTLKEDLIPNEISQKLIKFLIFLNQEDEQELEEFIHKEKEEEKENHDTLIFKRRKRFKLSKIQDKEHFKILKEWINDDDFFSKMKLGFSAKKDGFDCTKWHSTVDDKGKTLVIIKTTQNFIFGGFTKNGWISGSNGRYISDSDAFIFSLRNDKNDRESQKFTVKQGEEGNAIYYHSNFGPIFGFGHDLYLKSDLKTGCTDFGWAYDTPNGITYDTDEAQSYLAGSYDSWIVDEVETYFI